MGHSGCVPRHGGMGMSWHLIDAALAAVAVLIVVGVRVYDRWARWQAAHEWTRLKRERRDVDARLALAGQLRRASPSPETSI